MTLNDEPHDPETWVAAGWTGEQDSAAAIALGACLALAALAFLVLAAVIL